MSKLLAGIVPWFGGHPDNLKRTCDSLRQVCDEVLVVHQTLFDEDRDIARSIADKVEVVDWNFVFQDEGYGGLPNRHAQSKADWFLLLGVGETIAQEYDSIRKVLQDSSKGTVWRCDHHNDDNTWGRVFSPKGGVRWGGLIHEEAGGGNPGNKLLFRMQDTDKTPHADPFVNEALRWMKVTSYEHNYLRLLESIDPQTGNSPLLSYTNRGWLSFVLGSKEMRAENKEKWADLLIPAVAGDREAFLAAVRARMEKDQMAIGVNFLPTGGPMSEGA